METATSPEKSSIAATSAQTFTLRLLTLDDIDAAYDLLAHEDSAAASMWTPEQGKFYFTSLCALTRFGVRAAGGIAGKYS